ncbi:MAG: hypothetical protein R2867_11960 [Caldilineaceae bacterium]
MTDTYLSLPDRITTLLDHLGIQRAHIVARMQSDWHGLARHHPDRIASLSLLCGGVVGVHLVASLAERLYVMSSNLSPFAQQVTEAMQQLSAATYYELRDIDTRMWTDIAADFGAEIQSSMVPFIKAHSGTTSRGTQYDATKLRDGEQGEVAGITYAIHGNGEPLLLFPLTLAPSGWTPLLETLRKQFCANRIGWTGTWGVAALRTAGLRISWLSANAAQSL